ncbi:quinol:electron acceptor oxidoreductase subunit ActD, partial [Arthrospira platensis SPKY1]|nr:quinol:electron acceptor oxidoreductase subunit ActD [Arthrospira platensis SPKY1]
VYVGGQPLYPVPPSVVVMFELTMLGIMISTFLGVFLDAHFPSYSPKVYVPEISDGYIALLIDCAKEQEDDVKKAMTEIGAASVKYAEVQPL